MSHSKISEAIEKRLDELAWSRRELARQAGMNHATLGRKLNGRYSFTVEEMFRICLVLDLEISELFAKDAA